MAHREKLSGSQKFQSYYSEIYGGRWESLEKALLEDSSPISLSDELASPYYMDRASIRAASYLPVREGDDVLDMCAAPGGKTLVLALRLKGSGSLTSNDRSSQRRNRLHNVIETCLPRDYRDNITVTGHDSTKWGLYEQNRYDCILLDAPCSSERHVLKDGTALSQWGTSRPKTLAIQQFAMLAGALDAVKTGGYILYSTCSINPLENDMVIGKLFSKREGRFEEVMLETDAERQSHGYLYLPDRADGTGPLFFCLLRRLS